MPRASASLRNSPATTPAEVSPGRALIDSRRRRFFSGLTPPQLRFIRDPAKRKTARCSRRAGKTYGVGADLVRDGLTYPDPLAYIGLTRLSAKQILWDELVRWNAHLALDIDFNISELTAKFPNGAKLYVGGADTPRDIERWRGQRFRKIAIDECGSFGGHVRQLIEEVLSPSLMDLDGTLYLTGSPTASCSGIFYEATTGKLPGWSNHSWTWRDNPHVPQTWFAEEMARRGLTEDDPAVQREYFGRWVRSGGRLVYRYTDQNLYELLPAGLEWTYVLGVDLGYWDDCAFSVGAYSEDDPSFYVIEQSKRQKLTVDQVGAAIAFYAERYDIHTVVMDTGGLGKTIAETLNARGGLPKIIPAVKTEKMAHIAMLNGDLHRGAVKVRAHSPVLTEWDELQLADDGKEDPTQPNHLSDAVLYSWREARQWIHQMPTEGPKLSRERIMMDRHREKLTEGIERRRTNEADLYSQDTAEILRGLGL